MEKLQIRIEQEIEEPEFYTAGDEKTAHLFRFLGAERLKLDDINSLFDGFQVQIEDYYPPATGRIKIDFDNILRWHNSDHKTDCGLVLNNKRQIEGKIMVTKGRQRLYDIYRNRLEKGNKWKEQNNNTSDSAPHIEQLKKMAEEK